MSFLDVLVKQTVITKDDVTYILQEASEGGKTIEDVLHERGVSSDLITKAKSEYMQIPTKALGDKEIPFEVLKYIPEESALHYKLIPLGIVDRILEVGVVDPDNIEARDALNFISSKINLPFKIFLISEDDFNRALGYYKGLGGEVNKALTDLESEFSDADVEIMKEGDQQQKGVPNIIEDAPVTKIVATMLRYAIEGDVSDIHVEPMRERVRIRFRVDGVLNTSIILPAKVHDAVVARIKILSNMKLDEKRKPQDGRFSARIENRKIDFRVSTFPTNWGEKVVMRILDPDKSVQKLDKLGYSQRNLEMIKRALGKPYGLILISGPTGSGKTTTLYAMMQEVDRDEHNVLSLEDPIEYVMDGVSQSQVHPEIGYTFAAGLRTTLRQDPDIIMVGEIRDKETAQLAIQAALTGHLVLSTIHTNSSIGIIPRLIDMGVDPYLIAPTLILGMGQRLVGKAYEPAVKSEPVDESFKAMVQKQFADLPEQYRGEIPPMTDIYRVNPIPECPKGIKGRIAVLEAYEMDKELEKIILKDPTDATIFKHLRDNKGMITMKEDAIIRTLRKEIPFEETHKV